MHMCGMDMHFISLFNVALKFYEAIDAAGNLMRLNGKICPKEKSVSTEGAKKQRV